MWVLDEENSIYFNNKFSYNAVIYKESEDLLSIVNFTEIYWFLKDFKFIHFFTSSLIDVPTCFKKTKSLKRRKIEKPALKFLSIFSRHGLFLKFTRLFYRAFSSFNKQVSDSLINGSPLNFWLDYYYYFTSINFTNEFNEDSEKFESLFFKYKVNKLNLDNDKDSLYDHKYSDTYQFPTDSYNHWLYLLRLLSKANPTFCFYVYDVGKAAWKHSRGKTGRHKLVWKYVPPYKRIYLIIHWLFKEVRFSNHKTLQNKMYNTLLNFWLKPGKTLAWRVKTFSHNYVYKNFKFTLLKSLKTVR